MSELFHAKSRAHVSMVQLPGVDTPQFDWMKTDMPYKLKPASRPYASGLLDRYLGRTGVASQQADEPIEPGRQGNLWEPVDSGLLAAAEAGAYALTRRKARA